MSYKNRHRFIAVTIAGCILSISATPIVAVPTLDNTTKVLGTDTPFDYNRYMELHDELDAVMSRIHRISSESMSSDVFSTANSEHKELINEKESLLNQLDDMGAVLDLETLEKFPAPSSTQSRSDLTGNLADLAEYYGDWFEFTGYENEITYNGNTYRGCVITIRDLSDNNGLLTNVYNDNIILSESDAGNADDFSEIANTGFGIFADEVSNTLGFGNYSWKRWTVSEIFSSLVDAINSGTIVIQNANRAYYLYSLILESNLYYAYVWDEEAEQWVYCVSSGKVYVDEDHVMKYYAFVGGSGSQYDWLQTQPISVEYSITTIEPSQLCTKAVQLYSNYGDSAPSFLECYQVNSVEIKQRWNGVGNYQTIGDDLTCYTVYCERPGDLWTLGSMN